MQIKFKHLHAENFLSYENIDVDLDSNGYTMVSGVNENPDDASTSNGSGKSSLWEALTWCLTGNTIRGTKDVKRYASTGGCSVELTFDMDGNSYKVTRQKDPSNLFIYINDENKSGKGIKDTEKLLATYLPDLTAQLLGSVIILGQGLPQRFTNNSPSGRKEVLEQLSKSDFMLEDLKQRIADRKSALNTSLRESEDLMLELNTRKDVLSKQIETAKTKLDSIASEDVDFLESTQNSLTQSLQKYNEDKEKAVDELDKDLSSATTIKEEISELKLQLSNKQSEIKSAFNDRVVAESSRNASLKAEISSLKKEIDKIHNMKDTCPTCGQKLQGVVKPDTTEQEKTLETLNEQLDASTEALGIINKEVKDKCDEIALELNGEITEKEKELSTALAKISSDKDNLNKIEFSINDVTNTLKGIESKIRAVTQDKETLKLSIATNEEQCEKLDKSILYNKDTIEDIKAHVDVVNKMDNLIKRDFRGYLLTNVIEFIDTKAKEYSMKVFGTDKISFGLDGNNISISYCGREYENLSGGEKQRVDLIIQFAIRDMLCRFLDFSSNILVLDEIVDNLDTMGCQRVLDLISEKLSDVDSVYIISHHSEIPMPIDNEIIFVKGADGISRVK